MSFFIPGRTTCAICDEPIALRWQASQLPYVAPTMPDAVARLTQRFAHRACWAEWEYGPSVRAAAYDLIRRGAGSDAPLKVIFLEQFLIVFWIPVLRSYRLDDLDLLVTLDIPSSESSGLTDFLLTSFAQPAFAGEYQAGAYMWRTQWQGATVQVTVLEDQQVVDTWLVPANRHRYWLAGLQAMLIMSEPDH
jgi:hypothetical protein